jgi:hypothetical protein
MASLRQPPAINSQIPCSSPRDPPPQLFHPEAPHLPPCTASPPACSSSHSRPPPAMRYRQPRRHLFLPFSPPAPISSTSPRRARRPAPPLRFSATTRMRRMTTRTTRQPSATGALPSMASPRPPRNQLLDPVLLASSGSRPQSVPPPLQPFHRTAPFHPWLASRNHHLRRSVAFQNPPSSAAMEGNQSVDGRNACFPLPSSALRKLRCGRCGSPKSTPH